MRRSTVVRLIAAVAMVVGLGVTAVPPGALAQPPAPAADSTRQIDYHGWTSYLDFARGRLDGARLAPAGDGAITLARAAGALSYTDPFATAAGPTSYDYATWTSPVHRVGFGLTELVSSWTADTPHGTWVQVEMRGTTASNAATKWYVMGRWTSQMADPARGDIHRTSVDGQRDANGNIYTDTYFSADGVALQSYQLRVTLYREHGTNARPTVRSVGAIASALPDDTTVPAGPLGGAEGITLNVPTYSQEIHHNEYPEYDGGGSAWCSPTSTEMVTEYWGHHPRPSDLTGIPYADPSVDYAAMHVYDWQYPGAGNWPFNVAYAASYGLEGQVVQLHSMTDAERFIKAGIPLVVSIHFDSSELDGAGYSTDGHLMVIRGFAANGDVVVNDPASHLIKSDGAVETTYKRQQFANIWLPSDRSGGTAYVIHPAGWPVPRV
jgi:hypothetical protein